MSEKDGFPEPSVAGVLRSALKVKNQVQLRNAIRSALLEGAYQVAYRYQAKGSGSDEFRKRIKRSMQRAGSRPKRLADKFRSRLRGGPATLFDGPENVLWEDRVRALGSAAIQELQSDPTCRGGWAEHIDAETFGGVYLGEVLNQLSVKANFSPSGPEAKILKETKVAKEDRIYRRQNLLTRIRITTTKVLAVAVLGAGIGYAVHAEAPNAMPDWVELSAVAAIATAVGAVGKGSSKSQHEATEAAFAAILDSDLRRLRIRLKHVVDPFVQVIRDADTGPRAPPAAQGQPPTLVQRISTSAEVLKRLLDESHGVPVQLTLDGQTRQAIADACHELLAKAEDINLMRIDPVCVGWLQALVNAATVLTEQPLKTYDDQVSFGGRFMEALAAAWCVAAWLEAKVPEVSLSRRSVIRLLELPSFSSPSRRTVRHGSLALTADPLTRNMLSLSKYRPGRRYRTRIPACPRLSPTYADESATNPA